MDRGKIIALVSGITVLVNLGLAFSGVGASLSCTVASQVSNAYAAFMDTTQK